MHTCWGGQAIETLRIGQRVTTYLPDERREEAPGEPTSLEWAAHRVITLTLPCLDDETIHLQLLRDPDWFRLHQPEVGDMLWLDMPEMGVEGKALVEAIDDCPEIETGPGRVITATFAHSVGECLEFDIEGESSPLRVTGGHPLWRETVAEHDLNKELIKCCNSLNGTAGGSCDCESLSFYSLPNQEQDGGGIYNSLATVVKNFTIKQLASEAQTWVPAEEFQSGDSLKALNGLCQVINRHLDRYSERVYNIEVDGDHVFRVGENGFLVHNTSVPENPCKKNSIAPGQELRSTTTVQEVFQMTEQSGKLPKVPPTTFQWQIIHSLTANLNRVYTGTGTDTWMTTFIKGEHNPSRIGLEDDTAGHILPKAYGGNGLLQKDLKGPGIGNIIPQSSFSNGEYNKLQSEWNRVRKRDNSGCEVCIQIFDFDYSDQQHPLRPKSFKVRWWSSNEFKGEVTIRNE